MCIMHVHSEISMYCLADKFTAYYLYWILQSIVYSRLFLVEKICVQLFADIQSRWRVYFIITNNFDSFSSK